VQDLHQHQNLRVKSELGKKVEGSKISEATLLPNMGKDGVELQPYIEIWSK